MVADLRAASGLLAWDEQTNMPPNGREARASQLGTLDQLAHERFVDDEVGELLEELAGQLDLDGDDDDASLVRVTRRRYRKERQVPAELKFEIAHAASTGQHVWEEARAADDFDAALPALRRNIELARRYADCFDGGDPYDHLLDDYEEGMPSADVTAIFDALKRDLADLARAIAERGEAGIQPLPGPFDLDRQRAFVRELLGAVGFDDRGWRMDEVAHPFLAAIAAPHDLRLTTRYLPDTLDGGLAALHEFGHGLYSGGVAESLARTPLATSPSTGIDESQSRLWENVIGRGRPFAEFLTPLLKRHFPGELGDVDPDRVYRGFNVVSPTLIRVSADEVTYPLHVILRFELERDLISGELDPADLAERWRELFGEYLGIDVPSDAMGALQDVHWWVGLFGYFPTYALGTVMSLQVWDRLRTDIPDVDEHIASGQFAPARDWLRENLYRHGAKFTSTQMLERLTGDSLEAAPYLRYLRDKFGTLYGLEATSASSAAS